MNERDILYLIFTFLYFLLIVAIIDEKRKISKNVEELSKDVARIKKQLKKK